MQPETDSKNRASILFVEDDKVILDLQASVISSQFPGVILYTAVNGRLGLELFNMHKPDIVITDINMSEMSGLQMAESIRAVKPDTKFIAITGRTLESDNNGKTVLRNSDGNVVEFDHVITKPVELFKLFAIIKLCVGEIEQHVSQPA